MKERFGKDLPCNDELDDQGWIDTGLRLGRLRAVATDALDRFADAYAEYGEDSGKEETGLAGQWADIYRKVRKLKAPMWEGDASRLKRESEREILCDLIGHCILALGMIRDGVPGGRAPATTTNPPEAKTTRYV